MPKKEIDYSNTSFYKIVCKDINILDCYVGHTTNIISRRNCHKKNCINEIYKDHNLYVYQFIRANGGWCNWDLLEIEKTKCINAEDARKKERKFIEYYVATLNCVIPSRTRQEYHEQNKKQLTELNKKYREENKTKISTCKKEYYEKNKKEIIIKNKEYSEKNREKIQERIKKEFICICGSTFKIGEKSRHFKSKKHIAYTENNQTTEEII